MSGDPHDFSPHSSEMTKATLDTVKLGDSLGSGASGEVFAVEGGDFPLVVKRFNSLAIDRQFLMRNFSRLEEMPDFHGTPRIFDHRFDRAPYEVLMERVPGEPFSKLSSLKEGAAWKLIRQLAEILGHAHKHGVYHGHLHPGNILLSGEGREKSPLVTDYGSGLVGDLHHIELGESAYYAAPEQLLSGGKPWGEGRIQKWDVYSFGLIAFALINERLPRGLHYLKERQRLLARSGGRPVPVDVQAYVDDLYRDPAVVWGSSFALGQESRLCREVIDRCLSLDPRERPVDLREVRNQFRQLEHRFALEDAEDRVVRERRKQKAKLFGARAVAACLGLSFLGATYYLVDYLRKTYFFQNKVSELDQMVVTQQAHITHLDERWADTVTDLKQSREAADTFFQQMAQGDTAGDSGAASIKTEELEKSRDYYLKTLADVGESDETALERARALHSLAHIERKMGLEENAAEHFRSAIAAFEDAIALVGDDADVIIDIQRRLADSCENLSSLAGNPFGGEALAILEKAVGHFDEVIRLKPDDTGIVTRQAGTTFKLGRAYDIHRVYEKAIHAYARSAELAAALRESAGDAPHLNELVGKLQFQAAKSLRLAGRGDDAINAHVAAMETIEALRGVNGFSPLQSIQLAESYIELGELFVDKAATPEDLDQLYNESLRLLTALNTGSPGDVEVAILLCRSLGHLGVLEREDGQWSSGYRMSVRGIEALRVALETVPGHVEGTLVLAEARIGHLEFLKSEREAAIQVAQKGVETAESAGVLLARSGLVAEPLLTQYRERLSSIFRDYGEVCEALGEAELSRRCLELSAMQLSSLETPGETLLE
jgi:tetratricopeptide (TPR) repeat protein